MGGQAFSADYSPTYILAYVGGAGPRDLINLDGRHADVVQKVVCPTGTWCTQHSSDYEEIKPISEYRSCKGEFDSLRVTLIQVCACCMSLKHFNIHTYSVGEAAHQMINNLGMRDTSPMSLSRRGGGPR